MDPRFVLCLGRGVVGLWPPGGIWLHQGKMFHLSGILVAPPLLSGSAPRMIRGPGSLLLNQSTSTGLARLWACREIQLGAEREVEVGFRKLPRTLLVFLIASDQFKHNKGSPVAVRHDSVGCVLWRLPDGSAPGHGHSEYTWVPVLPYTLHSCSLCKLQHSAWSFPLQSLCIGTASALM